jgi:two-component system NtrC family sensor kinase
VDRVVRRARGDPREFLAAGRRRWAKQMDAPAKQDWLLDERLLQSQKLAAIGELSAGIAHEINNPLAIIRQEAEWMQLLLKKLGGGEGQELVELQGSIHQILQQVDRCTEIIRNLLDFARKRDPVIQAVEVNRIIESMTMLVEKEASHKNITIVRHYDENLPVIYSDAPQLRQIILNFLTNATQAIGQDGEIAITTRLSGADAVDIVISDTGCGIPEANLSKIFDPFFTTKPPGQGTGLGLSICHGLILRLGGRVKVASQVGRGTEFTITLPRSREAELFAHD